ncbi:MAG TPA: amino acid ABC transporter substrate-binding protein [Burkholderiaceae bacterium]|nr:amino acid ABC transporter substrate-binding protein [Burkholderiaceae bacterium]
MLSSAHAQEGRLAAIVGLKSIKVAHRTDATPFSFTTAFNEPVGYSVDLCKLVVEVMQRRLKLDALKIEWVPVTTRDRMEMVAAGKADLECGASTVTLSRMEQVDFSSIIFVESTGLLVKKDAGIASPKDLTGKKIAVIGGTTNETAVRNAFAGTQTTIVAVGTRDEGIILLERGGVDALASDKLLLVGAEFANPRALALLQDDLSIEPYALIIPRGDFSMRVAVNAALAEIFRSGEIVKIYDKWFGQKGLRRGPLLNAVYLLGAIPE